MKTKSTVATIETSYETRISFKPSRQQVVAQNKLKSISDTSIRHMFLCRMKRTTCLGDRCIGWNNISSEQWFCFSRNIGIVTQEIIYLYYLKKHFLDQSIQKILHINLKIEALVLINVLCVMQRLFQALCSVCGQGQQILGRWIPWRGRGCLCSWHLRAKWINRNHVARCQVRLVWH